jgi:hypothetical protein
MTHKRTYWIRQALIALAFISLVLGMARVPAQTTLAQSGGVLGYGSKVSGSITVDAPMVTYSFKGSPGDLVTVIADTWTGALNLQLDLIAPDGLRLSQSMQNVPGGDVMGAYLSAELPDAGVYLLRVSGVDGSTGDFLLTLLGRSAVASTPLVFGQSVDVTIPQNAPSQFFTFEAEDCPTTLVVTNLSPGQPFTFPFVAKVRDQRGQDVALLRGGEQTEDWVTVAPRSGTYEVEVLAVDPALSGSVRLLVTCSGDNPGCTGQPGIAGIPGGECRPCPDPNDLVPGGGCPDLNLSVQQGLHMAAATTVSWDAMPGADGYAVYVYGQTSGGGEVYLTHAEWTPGNPTEFTWILPVPGYTGYRFVLQVLVGDGVICTQEVSLDLELTEMQCPDLGLTGAITDAAVNAVTLNWAAGLDADSFDLVLNSIIDGTEIFSGVLTVPGDATSYAFDHFPPELDGVHLVLWMTRGDLLCSAEITITFGGEMQRVCPPRSMQMTRVNDTTILVEWDAYPGATQYVFWVEGEDGTALPGYPITTAATSTVVAYTPNMVRFVVGVVDSEAGILICPLELVIASQQQEGPCAVVSEQGGVWVHVGPGRSRSVFGFMEPGVEYRVTGQALDADGNPWWQLDKTQFPGHEDVISLWVMQSDVTALGLCSNIPSVEIPPVIPGDESHPPGTWGPCGSCDTCGFPANECVTSPDGACLWDPATCRPGGEEPPPGDDGGGETCYRLSTAADPSWAGGVSVLTGANCRARYRAGTSVQVSASVSDPKLHFDHWSGCGAGGSANPVTITMNGDCTITAHFAP